MSHRPSISRFSRLFLAVGLCVSGMAAAQHAPVLDRASLWIGGFDARSDTLLRSSSSDGSNAGFVNLEDDLGFRGRSWTPRVRADVLVGDSQGFSFDFYRYHRARSTQTTRTLTYEGVTYDTQASVRGKLEFDFGSAAYRWWFGSDTDVFGLGLGAGYYRVNASISGQATVNSMSGQVTTATNQNAWAPLLQVGWRHAIGDRWRLYLDASGVKKNGGHLYGHIYRAALGAQWFPTRYVGISLEYDLNRIRLWQNRTTYNNKLDLKLDGPSAFLILRY